MNIAYVHIGRHPSTNVGSRNLPDENWRGLPTVQAQLRSLATLDASYTLLIDLSEIGREILRDHAESSRFWRRIRSITSREHLIRPAALILGTAEKDLYSELDSIRAASARSPYPGNLLQGLRFRPVKLSY